MSAVPFVGLATTVEFGTDSPMESLAGVTAVTFSGDKVAMEKTTDMLTANGTDTFIGSTDDPGSCDIKCWTLPGDDSQDDLKDAKNAKVAIPFVVSLPGNGGTRSFSGLVESATVALPLEKNSTTDFKIKLTGPYIDTF